MMKRLMFACCLFAFALGCTDDVPKLHVYTWSDYFDPELVAKFEQENNCEVIFDIFDSNEAMFAKLKAGGTGYDVMIPSSYQIDLLAKEKLILPIDHSLVPTVIKNFNHDLDNQVLDSKLTWSIPYACTYTGIMHLKDKTGEIQSWNVFGDSKYKGKISFLDDIRETIGIGLMYNGYSLNSTNEQEIMAAAKQIVEWRSNIRKFDAESYKLEVANKSSWLGHGYSSDAAQVILGADRDDICFTLPNEGFTIAWDEFVISSTSVQKDLAYKFIDFFYITENSYKNMTYICSLMANKEALLQVDNKTKAFILPKNLDKGQLLKGFDDQRVLEYYNKAWDFVKATDNR